MAASGESPPQTKSGGRQTLTTIGVVLLSLLGFATFFIGFLIAPLAILVVFGLVFAARNKS
jgi:hypothetical protein